MFDHVLFPTDGEAGADEVLEYAVEVAASHDATLHLLYVADTTHDSVTRIGGEVVDVLEREGEQVVEAADERVGGRVETVTEVLQGGVPETITDYATEYGVDLVVMPTRGRTGLDHLLGSTTERVVRRSAVPVVAVRPDDAWTYPCEDVLVATDGSACADAALEWGIDLAVAHGATLHVLSVVDVASLGPDVHSDVQVELLDEQATEAVEAAEAAAEDAGVSSVVGEIERGSSVHGAINAYAEDHEVDLLAVGTHGRTGVDRYLLGSVAEKLARTSPVPVSVVPSPED